MSATTTNTDAADDLHFLLNEQRRELMAAGYLDSDLDYAFNLQLEEAISASLANLTVASTSASTSTSSASKHQRKQPLIETVPETFVSLHVEELTELERELSDRDKAKQEMIETRKEIERLMHDQKFAKELSRIPEDDWLDWGDEFEKPFGEGCSKMVVDEEDADDEDDDEENLFRLYFKGLMSQEKVNGENVVLSGVGIAICDSLDNLIFELRKPLIGFTSKNAVETMALVEGLNAALSLDLKRLRVCSDYLPLYRFVTGRWSPKQRKTAALVNQVSLLQRKFRYCNPTLVARNDVKYVFEFARAAIASQVTQTKMPTEPKCGKNMKETCVICLEDTDVEHIFSVDGCLHRYCFSCMKQHVEVKLLHAMAPKCPHEDCKSELKVDSCSKFLTPKLLETFSQRIKEASIPASERVYCPRPRCSALMTKLEVLEYAKRTHVPQSGMSRCVKCQSLFCINCKVPWHNRMTCFDYKRLNPNPPAEDVKLKSLASTKLWRQCVKCNHMIELSEGCYHMTCRCGFEFCYNCGAEWKNKKPTCNCPLWDEGHIGYRDSDEEDDVDDGPSDSDSD